MKKSFFDILLDQVLRDRDAEEAKPPQPPTEDEEAKTLEEKAKKEAEKRERKKIAELLKKEEEVKQQTLQKFKRVVRQEVEQIKKEKQDAKRLAILESPTKHFLWKCVNSKGDKLHGIMEDAPVFEIQRGLFTYKLTPLHGMRERMERAKAGNIFSAVDVQTLKNRAERALNDVLAFEKKNPVV